MVFDTTASNTGHKTEVCVSIPKELGKPLLWPASRHHTGETVLRHVWENLNIEASKAPEITVYSQFKSTFSSISCQDLGRLNHDINLDTIGSKIEENAQLLKEIMNSKNSKSIYQR